MSVLRDPSTAHWCLAAILFVTPTLWWNFIYNQSQTPVFLSSNKFLIIIFGRRETCWIAACSESKKASQAFYTPEFTIRDTQTHSHPHTHITDKVAPRSSCNCQQHSSWVLWKVRTSATDKEVMVKLTFCC